jgi:hypothetical protein
MKKRSAVVCSVVVVILLAIYVVSYFRTSRITTIQMADGGSLSVRLMQQRP